MGKLTGKTAVVTGGTSGIGFGTAKLFLSEGATVWVSGSSEASARVAGAELPGATVVHSDASDPAAVRLLLERASAATGGIDVLFLNAGIARVAPFAFLDESTFDQVMSVNLRGAWLAIKHGHGLLRHGASVMVTTSIAGDIGVPGMSAYSPSKAALRSLAQTAAIELAPLGIRVNAICAGPIETPIFDKMGLPPPALAAMQEQKAMMGARIPLGRTGRPDDVARLALFLASDDASFVTGSEVVIDGGFSHVA